MSMEQPKPEGSQTEETFEWTVEDGKFVKITKENSNGRKCECCGCSCPCKCSCCKKVCCSLTKKLNKDDCGENKK